MKLFFTILSIFNILNACTINFFDEVKSYDTMYGHMRFLKEVHEQWSFDKGKINHVYFLEKNYNCIGESFACWRHCNRIKKHRIYDAHVVKKEIFGEQEYHICVYDLNGSHEFDMILAKDQMGINYEIRIFAGNKHRCIFVETILANNECCCIFSGNYLVKLLQKDLFT